MPVDNLMEILYCDNIFNATLLLREYARGVSTFAEVGWFYELNEAQFLNYLSCSCNPRLVGIFLE